MASGRRELLVATGNTGKLVEIAAALSGLGISLLSLNDVADYQPPPEDGLTYAHNALIKAATAAQATGLPTLADDSGLEVDALGGEPGVLSARFGGINLDDAQRNHLLLQRLAGVGRHERSARFRAVLVLQVPHQPPAFFEGTVEGAIATEPRGHGGFGYDPIFCPRDETGIVSAHTFAQLSTAEKNRCSHRGQALQLLRQALTARTIRM